MTAKRIVFLATSLLLVSCASQGEGDGEFADYGKADFGTSCEGAALDEAWVCRLEDGTFAKESCCDSEFGEDGTFDDGAGIGCIFGDHLVEMARMRDLSVNQDGVIDSSAPIDGIVLDQVLDTSFQSATTLADVLEETDEGEMEFLTVRDEAHRRNFNMYIWSSGDNIVGRIYYSQSLRIAAEIGDGSIGACDAGFSNFDELPFFYTN